MSEVSAYQTPALGLPLLAGEQAQKHVTVNEALAALDSLVQLSAASRDLSAPPAAPAEGDRYIVAQDPSGAWAGHADEFAVWRDGAWSFHTPRQGWLAWVNDEGLLLVFDGTGWTASVEALQNLALLGLGTAADAQNPFAAKLNKALWTARTAAEGGSGDLRYTMNKEGAADVLSLLFQTGFSGRAELGLIGDDKITLKMSADGADWTNAAVVDGQGNLTVDSADSLLHVDAANNRVLLGSQVAKTNIRTTAGSAVIPNFQKVAAALDKAAFLFALDDPVGSNPPNFYLAKGRAGGGVVGNADRLGNISWNASDGINYISAACIRGIVDGGVPGVDSVRGAITFETSLDNRIPAERVRINSAGDLQMGGANTVIDASRHVRLRAYTVATLPAAGPAGQVIFCSDLGGGGGQLNSDGAAWRRVSRGGSQTVATDAAFTLTTLASAEEQRHTGALTANRSVTLSAVNAYSGARFRVTRTGGGAFNLEVGGLRNLATNSWCEVIHDGSAWYLAAYGTL